jgi:hypothetical protein
MPKGIKGFVKGDPETRALAQRGGRRTMAQRSPEERTAFATEGSHAARAIGTQYRWTSETAKRARTKRRQGRAQKDEAA